MRLLFLGIVVTFFSAMSVHAQRTDTDWEEMICKESASYEHALQLRGLTAVDDPSIDLLYYRFDWWVDPAIYQIDGVVTTVFRTVAADVQEIELQLSTQLIVTEVQYHGTSITGVQHDDYGLTIQLPAALPAGTIDSFTITYGGIPPSGGFGSFIKSTQPDNTPIIWTLSEPFGAQDWWPCKNGLTDKVDSIDVYVHTPYLYRAASNGLLVEEIPGNFTNIYHWKHRYPIAPYLVAIAVTDYAQYTDIVPLSNGTQLPMLNYVYPANLAEAQQGTADLVQVLQFYDSLFVTYPFESEKYGHAQFGWGGGMEHQTMSYVINFSWGLLSHELAHQWFGDMVTCGSWEDIWLNEGFATFLEGLTRERFGQDAEWWDWRANRLNSITGVPDGSVRVDDTTSVGRIFSGRLSYNKGAYLLRMLRWELGDEAFFQGIRAYLNDKKYSYAKTPALKAHLEASSNRDLTAFFNDWYYGQGFPSYQILVGNFINSNQLSLTVQQTTSHPSVPFYEMTLPILVKGAGVDTLLRLSNTSNNQNYEITLGFHPESVEFDPELWIVSANNTISYLVETKEAFSFLQGLTLSPNPTAGELFIETQSDIRSDMQWLVVNSLGQTVYSSNAILEKGAQKHPLDLRSLPGGLYALVMVYQNEAKTVGKIVIK